MERITECIGWYLGLVVVGSVITCRLPGVAGAGDPQPAGEDAQSNRGSKQRALLPPFDCGFKGPGYWQKEIRHGVERGEIGDPTMRDLPELPPPLDKVTQISSRDYEVV